MSYSFGWQRDCREGMKKETKLKLFQLENYPDSKEFEFTIMKETGRGGNIITYEAMCQNNGTSEKCFLKELYPEHICENKNLFRARDEFSLAVSHGFDDDPSFEKDFSIIDSEVWKSFEQDYQNIKKLRLDVDKAPLFICDAYEIYRNESTYYLKVPFETNTTLGKHIEETDMKRENLMRILTLGEELAIMTEKLHNAGYLHLDIKPENLLYKSIDDRAAETLSFLDMGTVVRTEDIKNGTIKFLPFSHGYSSPEQESKRGIDLTCPETTDIFSIGAVIFKMLTGNKPEGSDCRKGEFDFYKEDPRFRKYDPTLIGKLNTLLCKTLSISPSFRFQSCTELVEHIESMKASLDNLFYKAIDGMNTVLTTDCDGDTLFKWESEEFKKDLFSQVSYDLNSKSYDSLYELILDYPGEKRSFWIGGQGGRGKSSHLKRLVFDLCCAEETRFAPIYINSEKISNIINAGSRYANKELKKAICDELSIIAAPEDLDLKISLLEEYKFAIMIDGLNEIDESRKKSILSQIDELQFLNNCIFIVSDRGTHNFDSSKYVSISINPLNEDIVKSKLKTNNPIDSNLISLLSENIYLLKKLIVLNEKEAVNNDKESRGFTSSADVLSSYFDSIIRSITGEIERKNKEIERKKLVDLLAKLAFDSSRILTLSVDEDFLYRSFDEDPDYINAVKNSKFFVSPNKVLKFEHQLIRDFIIAYSIKNSVELCCEKNSAEYIDEYLSEELPDGVLKFLGELLEENNLSQNAESEKKSAYNQYCIDLTGNVFKRFINGSSDVRCNNTTPKEFYLTYILYLVRNASKKTHLKFNIIRAIVLGRGYNTLETLLSNQAPDIYKNTGYEKLKKSYRRLTSGLKKLLLNLQVETYVIDRYSLKSEGIKYSKYVGEKAQKRNNVISVLCFSAVILTILASFIFYILNLPRPVINTEAIWVEEQHTYSSTSVLNVWFAVQRSNSNILMPGSFEPEDFVTKGFDAEIKTEPKNGKTYVYLENIKPVSPNSEYEVGNCQLILKKNSIYCEDGLLGNKETVVADFDMYFSDTGSIECFVGNHFSVAKEGLYDRMHICFASHEKFKSDFSTDDMVFYNFSADTNLKEFCSGGKMPEDLVIFARNFFDEIDTIKEYEYVYFYELELENLQSTGEDKKYIEFLNQSVVNHAGVFANQNASGVFEIYETIDTLAGSSKPKVLFCKMVSSNVIPIGGALRIDVRFFLSDPMYDTYLQSNLTKEKIQLNGFEADIFISNTMENNAHYYAIFLSNVVPEKEATEYSISFLPRCAVSASGEFNMRKDIPLNIMFTDEIVDTTPPTVSIGTPLFYDDTLAFDIKITDDSTLQEIDREQLSQNIMLINAMYNEDISIQYFGDRDTYSYRFHVNIYGVSIINPNEDVLLQILPNAVCDSSGNPSALIQESVFWSDYVIEEYNDINKAVISPETVVLDKSEAVVDENNCVYFKYKTSDIVEMPKSIDHLRFSGMTATKNVKRIKDDTDGWITVKLTDVKIIGEYGVVTVWAKDPSTGQVYANELIVTKNTSE